MSGQNKCRPLSMGSIVLAVLIAGLFGWLILAIVTGYFAQDNTNAAVPVHCIPAYHIITANEFTDKVLDNDTLPTNAIHNISPYVNESACYYTLEPLESDKPFSEDMLFGLQNLTDLDQATVVGIPATLATSLGGKVQRGDVVELIVPGVEGNKPLEIENVHVLDIRGNTSNNGSAEFTIVAVLPRKSALRLINEAHGNRAFAIRALGV